MEGRLNRRKSLDNIVQDALEVNSWFREGLFEILSFDPNDRKRIITQDKYGLCSIAWNNLRKNYKPSVETALNKTEYWISMAHEIHGDTYDYSKVNYKNNKEKIKIICPIHGEFEQLPSGHLSRRGCTFCKNDRISEWHQSNPGGWSTKLWIKASKRSKHFDGFKIYIIKMSFEGEEFFKIGRTFCTLKKRFNQKDKFPYSFEELMIYCSENAEQIVSLENSLKLAHKDFKYVPKLAFNGMYECFTEINFELVNELCKRSLETEGIRDFGHSPQEGEQETFYPMEGVSEPTDGA